MTKKKKKEGDPGLGAACKWSRGNKGGGYIHETICYRTVGRKNERGLRSILSYHLPLART